MADNNRHLEKEGKKITWIRKDGVINIDLETALYKQITPEETIDILKEIKVIIERVPRKRRVLIKMTPYLGAPAKASSFRKKLAKRVKELFQESMFDKIGIFGGDIISRTVTLFIVKATGIKNVKVFVTKEEVLKWLKE